MNLNVRKQAGLAVAAAFAFAAVVPTQAVAAPIVNIVAGDFITLGDGPGSISGEFYVDVLGKGVVGTDFISFCLEKNEGIGAFGSPLKVGAVSTAAVHGGLGGGDPDPISVQTAWIFTQFTLGTLSNYTHTQAMANQLQQTIWYLENEVPLGAVGVQGLAWIAQANASGWTNVHSVHVLNMLKKDGSGNYTLAAQDQLALIPEPETYAMLLAGLGLMGFVARRRQRKLASS